MTRNKSEKNLFAEAEVNHIARHKFVRRNCLQPDVAPETVYVNFKT